MFQYDLQMEKERQRRLKAEEREQRLLNDPDQDTRDSIKNEKLADKDDELAQLRAKMMAQVRANEAQVRAQVVASCSCLWHIGQRFDELICILIPPAG